MTKCPSSIPHKNKRENINKENNLNKQMTSFPPTSQKKKNKKVEPMKRHMSRQPNIARSTLLHA